MFRHIRQISFERCYDTRRGIPQVKMIGIERQFNVLEIDGNIGF